MGGSNRPGELLVLVCRAYPVWQGILSRQEKRGLSHSFFYKCTVVKIQKLQSFWRFFTRKNLYFAGVQQSLYRRRFRIGLIFFRSKIPTKWSFQNLYSKCSITFILQLIMNSFAVARSTYESRVVENFTAFYDNAIKQFSKIIFADNFDIVYNFFITIDTEKIPFSFFICRHDR